jgi:hypothetical protein
LFGLSSIPDSVDKVVHTGLSLILGALFARALTLRTSLPRARAAADARDADARRIVGAWLETSILRRGKSMSAL